MLGLSRRRSWPSSSSTAGRSGRRWSRRVVLGAVLRRVQRLPRHAARPAVARGHDRHADALPRHRAGDPARPTRSAASRATSRTSASCRSRGTHIPYSIAFFAVLAVVFAVVLHATPLGRAIFAIGAGQEAAFFAGIRVKRIKFWLFVLSGMLSGFAGILWTLRFASARYDSGIGLELYVVTIVLLGGISIFGGRGTIVGVVLAVARPRLPADGADARPDPGAGSEHRRRRAADRERDPAERGDLYRRARARLRSAAARQAPRPRRRGRPRDESRASRRLRDRPRRVLAAVRGPARAARGLPARDRGAARASSAPRSSRPGSSTRPRARARRARRSPQRASTSCCSTRRRTRRRRRCCRRCRRSKAPVVILNLQPTRTLDYEAMTTGEWLANCSACCVPELAGAFTRARIPYRTVTGTLLDGDPAWDALARLGRRGARRRAACARARIGFLGHTYPGMLDMYSDFTQVHAQTGAHVEVLEIDDLVARVEAARRRRDRAQGRGDPRDVRPRRRRAPTRSPPRSRPSSSSGRRASRSGSTASSRTSTLDGLTYYYRGVGGNIAERVDGRPDRRQLAAHRARRPGRPARAT